MSKIGNSPIKLLKGVDIQIDSKKNIFGGFSVIITGPKGSLTIPLQKGLTIDIQQDEVHVKRENDSKNQRAFHGLYRSLINNAIFGVVNGYEKLLEIQGIGYRVELSGNKLTLKVGYSHPIEFIAPDGIVFECKDNVSIKVSGIDKALVGKVAADIRAVRKPEPYKGKGIRYSGEEVKKKSGKTAGK